MNPDSQVNQGSEDPRRGLPSVDRLARAVSERLGDAPAWAVTEAARQVLDALRVELSQGATDSPELEELVERTAAHALELVRPRPSRVVNATGVVLHTNLGRAVLADGAAAAANEAARSYSDLELDPATGRRGNRLGSVSGLLARLSGAEAAFAVNNNAAATLLALDTLARGREVVVSRGELTAPTPRTIAAPSAPTRRCC